MTKAKVERPAVLGRSGVRCPRLAVGTGTDGWAGSSAQTRKGNAWLAGVLREAAELGVGFWDLADEYGSHAAAATALRGLDRDELVITTKTTSADRESCARDLERFQREIGTDRLDVVLLHCVSSGSWNRKREGAMEALSRAKETGTVRAVGVSVHSLSALRTAVKESWVDVLLVRLNFAGVNMDAPPRQVVPLVRRAREAGKGVCAMKVLGCGKIANQSEKAIRYVIDSGVADAMTIGPTEDGHLRELVRLVQEAWGP